MIQTKIIITNFYKKLRRLSLMLFSKIQIIKDKNVTLLQMFTLLEMFTLFKISNPDSLGLK